MPIRHLGVPMAQQQFSESGVADVSIRSRDAVGDSRPPKLPPLRALRFPAPRRLPAALPSRALPPRSAGRAFGKAAEEAPGLRKPLPALGAAPRRGRHQAATKRGQAHGAPRLIEGGVHAVQIPEALLKELAGLPRDGRVRGRDLVPAVRRDRVGRLRSALGGRVDRVVLSAGRRLVARRGYAHRPQRVRVLALLCEDVEGGGVDVRVRRGVSRGLDPPADLLLHPRPEDGPPRHAVLDVLPPVALLRGRQVPPSPELFELLVLLGEAPEFFLHGS
mmetsp:Transcript_2258/g.5332  ORF Transcript_2258/g.5332 Transcript_2258/m.5332 type:complete len:276 (+) Transcript_2258:73-900(+)